MTSVTIKGIVHRKVNILSLLALRLFKGSRLSFFSSVEHNIRTFKECYQPCFLFKKKKKKKLIQVWNNLRVRVPRYNNVRFVNIVRLCVNQQ